MKKIIYTALMTSLLIACGKEKASTGKELSQNGQAISVTVQKIEPQNFEDWQEFTADLKGSEDIQIVTRIGGKLDKLAKVGQRVSTGQSLCSIENERLSAMVDQANAALALAKSEDSRLKANVEAGSLGKDVLLKSKLDVENAKVALLSAKLNLKDNQCPAPFGGVVASRSVEDYQFVAPGVPLLRLVDDRNLMAVVAIPEMQSRNLKVGQAAKFSLVTDPTREYDAQIKEMDLASDPRTRTYKARFTIPNPSKLKVGMVGRVKIRLSEFPQAILIPSAALLRLQDGNYVMVAKGQNAEKRRVEIGNTKGDQVHVLSGLNSGDLLITSGAFRLTPGTAIRVQGSK